MTIVLSILLTLIIIFIVPILIYGAYSAFFSLKQPEKKMSFFAGVLLQKVGTAIGFVGLFYLGRAYFIDYWLLYSLIWVLMFAITEIGQVLMSDYTPTEASAGIISEVIYFPLAGVIIEALLA